MIKAIILDFDGTLSNRKKNAYDIFDAYLRKFFPEKSDIEYEALLQDFITMDCNGTISVKYRLIPFMNKYGQNLPENFEEEFTKYYYDHMFEYAVLKPEMLDILNKLKGKYKLAVLSNGDSKSQHAKIDACNMNGYFDEIMVSGDYGINKPDKRIFEMMAEKLSVKPEECVFVGDVFSSDILGAINANMTPVWITADFEIPAKYYDGIRIERITSLLDVLENLK